MFELILDLWGFLKSRKKIWFLPLIIIMLIFGILILLAQNAALAPLIYTLF